MANDLGPRQREMLAKLIQSRLDRRSFVKRTVGAAGSVALASSMASAFTSFTPSAVSAAQARLQQTGDSAEAAVAAAQQFKGITLNVVWEDGLQSQDPTIFSGPKWEELTGIKINTVSKPFTELFSSQVAEHIGATGAYDVLQYPPSWTADFVTSGLLEQLDPFMDQYMNKADLDDYHPLYRGLMNYSGKFWGLFDDGDVIILYYRTDLFEDQKNKDDFKAQFGVDLAAPKDWTEYDNIQSFFTERGGGNTYGGASQRAPGQVYGWFSGGVSQPRRQVFQRGDHGRRA